MQDLTQQYEGLARSISMACGELLREWEITSQGRPPCLVLYFRVKVKADYFAQLRVVCRDELPGCVVRSLHAARTVEVTAR